MYLSLLALLLACAPKDEPAGPVESTPSTATPTTTSSGTTPPPIAFEDGRVPKNLLFLSIDTLRKDHVGAHATLGLTPYLDSLSTSGVVMDDHVQCSNWTFASATCTLHGRNTPELGQVPRLEAPIVPLDEGSPTLASAMSDAGWHTVLVTGNAFMSPVVGSAVGYSQWEFPGEDGLEIAQLGIDLLQDAIAAGSADDGWFLHLHYMEPHERYDPEPEFIVGLDQLDPWPNDLTLLGALLTERELWPTYTDEERALLLEHLAVLYQGEVRKVDDRIAWTMAQLEASGLLDDTLVVVWTDHGEQFWEHGFQAHAQELHYGENDAVLFFWSHHIVPGRYTGGTSAIDLAPTVLDLHDIPIPPEMTGIPVGQAPADRVRFAETVALAGPVQSAVRSGLKLQYNWDGTVRFYDRSTDPLEANDLYDPTDPELIELWCAMEPVTDQMATVLGDLVPTPPAGLSCPP